MEVKYPETSSYDLEVWKIMSGFWHPVARVSELNNKPFPVKLLDVSLVIYQINNKTISIALDICPHRGTPLSKGWIERERIICPYHGLEFDKSGQCKRVPASEPHADNCAAIKLTMVNWCERYGLIWVNLSGKPTRPLPNWPTYEDDSFIVVDCESELWNASAGRHAENFNDVAHLSFIHAGTFGNPNDPLIERYKVDKTSAGFNRAFNYNEIDKIDYLSDKSEVVSKIYNYRYTYPFSSELEMKSPDGRVMTIYDSICPESPTTSRIFISLARNYDKDTSDEEITKWQAAVNAEDRWVVESQLPKLLPLNPRSEKHIAADAWSLEFRTGFVKLGISRDNGI